jgi:hypothetical protein
MNAFIYLNLSKRQIGQIEKIKNERKLKHKRKDLIQKEKKLSNNKIKEFK